MGSRRMADRRAWSLILLQSLRSRCVSTGQVGDTAGRALPRRDMNCSLLQRTASREPRQQITSSLVRLSCAMTTSPGPNLPSAESLIRRLLRLGKRRPMVESCCSERGPPPSSSVVRCGSAPARAGSRCSGEASVCGPVQWSPVRLREWTCWCRWRMRRIWSREIFLFSKLIECQNSSDWLMLFHCLLVIAALHKSSIPSDPNKIFSMSLLFSTVSCASLPPVTTTGSFQFL
mmetsp:Transcript_38492/g.108788  ORF Transcript_38492/g.108788 Transcript_38492/m.108788 type:complete len:232 (+) Transcript_38492:2429-3124(+)